MKWALGYATRGGMLIRPEAGKPIRIPSVKVGNMLQPDSDEFVRLFLDVISPDDVVLSPSGPNYTYLPGAYSRGAKVFWIHPGKVKGVKKLAAHLLERFEKSPGDFYEYLPQDARVNKLGMLVRDWMACERQRVADENAASQLLRRQRDFFRFHSPDREGWIDAYVGRELRSLTARILASGVSLTNAQRKKLETGIRTTADGLYSKYFDLGAKADSKAREELAQQRLNWFGVSELEDFTAEQVRKALGETPENALFDGLIGPTAVKTRAEMLTFIRNPLFYPNAGHLRGYAGMSLTDGQAHQRRRGEPSKGNPTFHKVLCFDFASKYWQCDPIGFFRALYYAYKSHQYRVYWDLIELTLDVFKALRLKGENGHSVSGSPEEEVEAAESESASGNGEVDVDEVRALVERLDRLRHLPIIARSSKIPTVIDDLVRSPNPVELRRLFSRSPAIKGLNLQMPPTRIEAQIKRMLGVTLLDTIYYRWLKQLGFPLPLAEDFIYLRQWRTVEGRSDGVPDSYDHQVKLRYFQMEAERMANERAATGRQLPDDIEQKLVPREEREPAVS